MLKKPMVMQHMGHTGDMAVILMVVLGMADTAGMAHMVTPDIMGLRDKLPQVMQLQ